MDQISSLLQGGYAYLLIFQIVVVSSLFLLLIGMVLKRMKTEVGQIAAMPDIGAGTPTAAAANVAELEELKAKYAVLEEEMKKGGGTASPDTTAMQEKIKFLESKLLEYEILQEEIGSLSTLKNENEKLKKDLLSIQSATNQISTQEVPAEPKMVVPTDAPPATPEVVASAPAEPPGTDNPPTTPPPPADEAKPSTDQNLDGLLKEIDALSAQSNQAAK